MDSTIEDLVSLRYVLFPDAADAQSMDSINVCVAGEGYVRGRVGPHMSFASSKCDKEDLCRVQARQAEGFYIDRASLERRLPALPLSSVCRDATVAGGGTCQQMPQVQHLMPEVSRAAAR